MSERISALMDGELDARAAEGTLEALLHDPQALEAWRTYHLIGDALRDTPVLSTGFAGRIADRIDAEPTVLAPRRLPPRAARPVRWPAAAAAALAGVALVGYVAFNTAPESGVAPAAPLAQAPVAPPAAASRPTLIPLPRSTPDYLLAHQGFSPRVSLQGMAPYVRTVSDEASGARR
ncbi:MAG TPA: sigma-E factor negative regulatory protein [Burkholderiales bacterium]|nr:sigma-E factor negative regulatory protein [Burkholderiales bacterium]